MALLRRLLLPLVAAALLAAHAARGQSSSTPGRPAAASPAAYIARDPDLSTLNRILTAAGPSSKAASLLKSGTEVQTVFAPTNKAFVSDANKVASELGIKSLEAIYTTPKAAERLLENLIIPNVALTFKAFKDDAQYKSVLGQKLWLKSAVFTKQFYIESEELKALIIETDIPASRSVVHKTERVPVPDDFL